MMHRIVVDHDFAAPAGVLWDYLRDFANIERWWPKDRSEVQIERVELEGEGIGLVRHLYVSERLDYQDAATMTYKLSIVGERPAGLAFYQATGQIEALDGNRCRLNYQAEFTTVSGAPEEAEAFLHIAYDLMFSGLESAIARLG